MSDSLQQQRQRLQGIGMGFLAGWVDTLGFIALFGLFTAHVTGNFVLIGVALADASKASILLKFLAFPAFVAGVAVTRLLVLALEARQRSPMRPTLLLQLALLCGFMLCGLLAAPIGAAVTPMAMAAGLLGTAAMGVHSAASRLLLTQLAPTSMMTGNVTQLVIDGVDFLRGAGGATAAKCGKFFWPVAGFGVGAIGAAFAYLAFGFWALLAPIAILCIELARPDAAAPSAASRTA